MNLSLCTNFSYGMWNTSHLQHMKSSIVGLNIEIHDPPTCLLNVQSEMTPNYQMRVESAQIRIEGLAVRFLTMKSSL